MAVVAVAITLSFHLKTQPSAVELRMARPLGLVFWLLAVACLGLGLANYVSTWAHLILRRGFLFSPFFLLLSSLTPSIAIPSTSITRAIIGTMGFIRFVPVWYYYSLVKDIMGSDIPPAHFFQCKLTIGTRWEIKANHRDAVETVNKYSRKAALVQSGWRTQTVSPIL